MRVIDLTGQRFGRLTVIERVSNSSLGHAKWLCECSCAARTRRTIEGRSLRKGWTRSCGCITSIPNTYKHKPNGVTELIMTQRNGSTHTVLLDTADFSVVSQHTWRVNKGRHTSYARTKSLCLHQLLFPRFDEVDHKDGNGLNNCRENLRGATVLQNSMNRKKRSGTSKYKGVHLRDDKKWQAHIMVNKKILYLGRFETEHRAARAYDRAALKYFGEWASLNFKERR